MQTRKKLRVGILFGGKSAEHEVSLQSAKNVFEAIDRSRFDVSLIAIDKSGRWLFPSQSKFLLHADDPKTIALNKSEGENVTLVPESSGALTRLNHPGEGGSVDVVFPILHGPFGEDGTVQGLLKLAGVPFVGASVLGSAVGMDKDVMKRLLRDAGIPVADFLVFTSGDTIDYETVKNKLGLPLFIKPANLGSSIGVSKVRNETEFRAALETAFEYDTKILIEEYIEGRELECALLGNEHPSASCIGEIIPQKEFYSYEAKYLDEAGALLEVPAKISSDLTEKIQALAIQTFQVLGCEGLARVDFFLSGEGKILVNEINTLPGFTKISMYPRLWGESGVPYRELITRLIELALERFEKEKRLRNTFR